MPLGILLQTVAGIVDGTAMADAGEHIEQGLAGGQMMPHPPPEQSWPAGHTVPQPPQLALSVWVLTQAEPQTTWPELGHRQLPLWQN